MRGEPKADILIVLASLRAEGTPRMALDLARRWQASGLRVAILELGRGEPEMRVAFDEMGVPVESCRIGHSGYLRYLDLIRATHRICRRYRPAAVLSMPFGLHSFVAMGAWIAGGARVCAHVGNPPRAVGSPAALSKARWIARIGLPFTHRLVCCSSYVRGEAVRNLSVPVAATDIIFNGVGIERFAAASRARAPLPERRVPVVGMVATLEGHKDQATLIRAAALLREQGVEVQVRLIGDGARREELSGLIRELDAPAKLFGSRPDVPEQVAAMDVFAFSTTPDEGLGIALIEAMAAGVPVVASDVPACREVLDEGTLGVLVAPGDPADLADGIRAILDHPKEARRRADLARGKVAAEFTAERMAERYLEVLGLGGQTLAAEAPGAAATFMEPCR